MSRDAAIPSGTQRALEEHRGTIKGRHGLQQGHGSALLRAIEAVAGKPGYRKLVVETYTYRDLDNTWRFYASEGPWETGRIAGYLGDGSDMIVYGRGLWARQTLTGKFPK